MSGLVGNLLGGLLVGVGGGLLYWSGRYPDKSDVVFYSGACIAAIGVYVVATS